MLSDFPWSVGDESSSRTVCRQYPLPPLPPPNPTSPPSPPRHRGRGRRLRLRLRLLFLSLFSLVGSFRWSFLSLGLGGRAFIAGSPLAFCLAGGLSGWPDRPLHSPFTSALPFFPSLALFLVASPIFQALSPACGRQRLSYLGDCTDADQAAWKPKCIRVFWPIDSPFLSALSIFVVEVVARLEKKPAPVRVCCIDSRLCLCMLAFPAHGCRFPNRYRPCCRLQPLLPFFLESVLLTCA